MRLFSLGKKKEKTLEELARSFNISIIDNAGEKYFEHIGTHEQKKIIGSGYTLEEAREHLISNAKDFGANYISNPGQPKEKPAPLNSKMILYIFHSIAYK